MEKIKERVTLIALCGVQGCCPTVEIHQDTNKIIITDDHGGQVTLTKEQWQDALAKIRIN